MTANGLQFLKSTEDVPSLMHYHSNRRNSVLQLQSAGTPETQGLPRLSSSLDACACLSHSLSSLNRISKIDDLWGSIQGLDFHEETHKTSMYHRAVEGLKDDSDGA